MSSSERRRASFRSIAVVMVVFAMLNALAAVAAYVWCGLASGISQVVSMGAWSTLEHARVLVLDPPPALEGVKDASHWGLFDYVTAGLVDALHATKWVACIIPAANAVALAVLAARIRRIVLRSDHELLESTGAVHGDPR